MEGLQPGILPVGQRVVLAIRLVGGSQDDPPHQWASAAGFQQPPGPGDVGLERRGRVAVSDPDDGLGRQVQDGVDLVLAEHPLE